MLGFLPFATRGIILGLIGRKPAHGFISLDGSSGKLHSTHRVRGLIRASTISRLCPAISAVPATLNLSLPNLDVTILASSSSKLTIGAFCCAILSDNGTVIE